MKVLAGVLFLCFVGGIMGLECFVCTEGTGAPTDTSACGDPFDSSTTDDNVQKLECGSLTAGFDTCAKVKATSGGNTVIARSCYASSACPSQNACSTASYGGASAEICCCSENDCNGAGSVVVNVVSTVALVFAAVVFTL